MFIYHKDIETRTMYALSTINRKEYGFFSSKLPLKASNIYGLNGSIPIILAIADVSLQLRNY